ncbi:hypothetical protein [uncultured Enterococcus sp.]|uniref:hypothetical protein n=1 Tax=uncultured Enterococcus sp. TaxID=167972 RepID=UPI002AA95337|nr:hypothetical protein [uncultured Enterococcus sp.]
MTMIDKVKGMSKKKKLLVAALLIVALGGTGTAVYANSQTQQKLNEAQAIVDKEYSTLQGLEKEIQALFDEKDSNFLAEGVTADQIDTLKEKVAAADKSYSSIDVDLKKLDTKAFSKEKTTAGDQLAVASDKLDLQEAVNALFSEKDKTALKGSTVNKDLAIVDNLDKKVIESVKELSDDTDESTFDQAISDLIAAAESQLQQIDTATTAVQKVYKDKVISTDQKLYDAAKKEVDKIKNAKAKKTLSDQLAKVKAAIDKKAQDAKVAEEKKQEEAAQVTSEAAAAENNAQAAATDQYAAGVDQSNGTTPAADTTTNNYYDYGASQGASGGTGSGAGSGQTPPPAQQPAAPSTPSTGNGIADQNQMNQEEQDAGNSDWSDFYN